MAHYNHEPGNQLQPSSDCPDFDELAWSPKQRAAPCVAWVWPAGATEPLDARTRIDGELALDRELLGVTDGSISRTANAPRMSAHSGRGVRLSVPAACATAVLVVQATDFASLQRGFGPTGRYSVCPAELGRRTRVALGEYSSLALLRSEHTSEPDERAHLVPLPRALRVQPGSEVLVQAPALVVVGRGAVKIQASVSVSPISAVRELPAPCSLRLPKAGLTFGAARQLDVLPPQAFTTLRVAGHEQPVHEAELPLVGRTLLTHLQRHFAFLPALLDDREPRLILLCERQDGSVGAWLSSHDVAAWLNDVEQVLSGSSGQVTTRITAAPAPGEPSTLAEPAGLGGVMTFEPRFAAQLQHVRKVADTPVSILVLGESGTGKEHLARAIHESSERANKPFIPVNCASLPEGLIESELFGHERGAFTGTVAARSGAFVAADGGTLLLDEIGDAPLRVQLALLRVLEDRRVKPVGADRERPVNVRVICATSRDLRELMARELFRPDLHYRLAGMSVTVPALRHRALDIPMLAVSLLQQMGHPGTLSDDALAYLQAHSWPGNIRELRQALQLAIALSTPGQSITAAHLQAHQSSEPGPALHCESAQFPSTVITLGEHLWRSPTLPPLQATSQYERRAQLRAALVYVCARYGKRAFPTRLVEQWQQLFGPRWATSENERGLRDVCKVLGSHPKDVLARSWVLGIVAG